MTEESKPATPTEIATPTPGKPNTKKVHLAITVACIASYFYFDVGTRWQLSGTWSCEQYNNGYPTTETFGFFGGRETVNGAGNSAGLHTVGRYSLSGKVLTDTPRYAERNGRSFDINGTGQNITFTEIISKLTRSELVYVLRDDRRSTMLSCHR